jgi:hypothetical protein
MRAESVIVTSLLRSPCKWTENWTELYQSS